MVSIFAFRAQPRQQEVSATPSIAVSNMRTTFPAARRLAEKAYSERLPRLREFITQFGVDPQLQTATQGEWTWMGDKQGLKVDGHCRIKGGKLKQVASEAEWNALPPSERANAYKGKGPVRILVFGPGQGRRFDVVASSNPNFIVERMAIFYRVRPLDRAMTLFHSTMMSLLRTTESHQKPSKAASASSEKGKQQDVPAEGSLASCPELLRSEPQEE
jgi:hypothetical protein